MGKIIDTARGYHAELLRTGDQWLFLMNCMQYLSSLWGSSYKFEFIREISRLMGRPFQYENELLDLMVEAGGRREINP